MPTFDVHVYPIFRTILRNVEAADARHAADLAESSIMESLAYPATRLHAGRYVFEYADGLDTSLVDTYVEGRLVESVSIGPVRGEAARLADALRRSITERNSAPVELLEHVLRFLRTVGR